MKSRIGCRKLSAPPVAHSATPTTAISTAVVIARSSRQVPGFGKRSDSSSAPHAKAASDSPSRMPRWSCEVPGSASASVPPMPAENHIRPEVTFISTPSSRGSSASRRVMSHTRPITHPRRAASERAAATTRSRSWVSTKR